MRRDVNAIEWVCNKTMNTMQGEREYIGHESVTVVVNRNQGEIECLNPVDMKSKVPRVENNINIDQKSTATSACQFPSKEFHTDIRTRFSILIP